MQICLRTNVNYYYNQKIQNIRSLQKELSSDYLYKEEREDCIKRLDRLRNELQNEINFLINDLEIINGEFSNLF